MLSSFYLNSFIAPPYSPPVRPPQPPSAPYACAPPAVSAPGYGPPPYPVGDVSNQPPQIGFIIPSAANQSQIAYAIPSSEYHMRII